MGLVCNICLMGFENQDKLSKHMQTHNIDGHKTIVHETDIERIDRNSKSFTW